MELKWLESRPPLELFCSLAAVIASAIFCATIARCRRRHLPPLPPGPTGFPLIGSLLSLDPNLHCYFSRLASTYGPIFCIRLGTKLGVVISSPSLAREVLRDHDAVFANRDVPSVVQISAYGGADIVWTPHGPTWRMLRKVCVREMLSAPSLDAVYALRRREVRAAVARMRERGRSRTGVEVGEEMFLVMLNVITSMLWGGTVEEEAERGKVGAEFRQLVGEMTELLGLPNLSDFFPALRWMELQGIERRMRGLLERFDGIFERIIKQRGGGIGGGGDDKDFLDYLLRLEKEGGDGKSSFTITHVKALLMDMVVGGTETASNTVEWALAEMMKKPEIMRRAQEELDRVVGKHDVVEESDVPKLPFLGAVVKEVLRLHPALPLLVPHCPSSTSTIGGYTVPKGSRVFMNVWAIHRDPAIWEEPLEFKPERYLPDVDGSSKWDYSGNDFGYFPFGSGRRICAGIAMAERMVGYSLASLLHSFDWELPNGCNLDLSERFGIVLKKAEALVAIPTPRLDDNELYV